ncbi:MAG: SDR family oxidoreductase [Chloroflexota bacterium]
MDLRLNGLRALVIGASRGLGYATARGLALEKAYVCINSRDPQRLTQASSTLTKESGVGILTVPGDVNSHDGPMKIVEKAASLLGGLDILITNSGGPPPGKFESFDDSAWQKAIESSLISHIRLIRSALPYLRQSKMASVLTITSYSVKQPIPNLILSNSIRSATVALTKSLALEIGVEGIRFNSILPAWTETERVLELMTHRANVNGTTVEEEIRNQAKECPLGRLATPEEFANAAVFLVSPAASYLNGVMLSVDGGTYKGVY